MGWMYVWRENTENNNKEENPRSKQGSQQVGSDHGPTPRLGPRNGRKCSWVSQNTCVIFLRSVQLSFTMLSEPLAHRGTKLAEVLREKLSHTLTLWGEKDTITQKTVIARGEHCQYIQKRENQRVKRINVSHIQTIEHFSRDFSCYKVICALKDKHIMYINLQIYDLCIYLV